MNLYTFNTKHLPVWSCLTAWLCLSFPAAISAAEPAPPPGISLGTMMQTFGILALILGVFIAAAWFVRRMNIGKSFMGNNGPLKVINAVTLGPRERIILVEANDTWLVIGIVPGQIRTLHTLPKGTLPPEVSPEGQFGQWLQQFREQRNDTKE